jgi:hypothetical protein
VAAPSIDLSSQRAEKTCTSHVIALLRALPAPQWSSYRTHGCCQHLWSPSLHLSVLRTSPRTSSPGEKGVCLGSDLSQQTAGSKVEFYPQQEDPLLSPPFCPDLGALSASLLIAFCPVPPPPPPHQAPHPVHPTSLRDLPLHGCPLDNLGGHNMAYEAAGEGYGPFCHCCPGTDPAMAPSDMGEDGHKSAGELAFPARP